jgi:RHS repeat-associated protein
VVAAVKSLLRDKNTDDDDRCDDQRLYYANDANMNVTALVGDDGTVLERYVYDPYGKVTIYDGTWTNTRNTSSYDNNILFAGYYHDWETGLYHVRNRYYHPYFGWITRDPAGYADGMSLYEYCRSGPLGALDAMGLCTDSPEKIAEDLKNGKIKSAEELKKRIAKLPKGQREEAVRRAQEELRGWQPKNEGPVRRGGGGGDGDGVWSWERGLKDYGNPLAKEDLSLAEALALRLGTEVYPGFLFDVTPGQEETSRILTLAPTLVPMALAAPVAAIGATIAEVVASPVAAFSDELAVGDMYRTVYMAFSGAYVTSTREDMLWCSEGGRRQLAREARNRAGPILEPLPPGVHAVSRAAPIVKQLPQGVDAVTGGDPGRMLDPYGDW